MEKESVAQASASAPLDNPKSSSNILAIIFKYVAIGTGIAGIGILMAVGGFLLGQRNNVSKKQVAAPTPTVVVTQVPTQTPNLESSIKDTDIAGQKRYSNPRFGISFIFPTTVEGESVDIKESGNKIYVYNTKSPYTQGQYIEVFQKDVTQTLDGAIQKQFLSGISPKDCFVKETKADSYLGYPVSFVFRTIGYPINENSDVPYFAQANKCPEPYTATNGLAYFLGDTKHPKAYLFFSIGQYAIPIAENSKVTWQDTIKFLD
jgi:hypothetical protein